MGDSHFARCLQGGGVFVGGGVSVTFDSCNITGNTASYVVRARAQNFPSPRWEFLLTCPIDSPLSIRIDIWFYQRNVRASHACKLPIAPMGKCLLTCPFRFSSLMTVLPRSTSLEYVPSAPENP